MLGARNTNAATRAEATERDAPPAVLPPSGARTRVPVAGSPLAIAVIALAGLALWCKSRTVAYRLSHLLPLGAVVRSRGTGFPSFVAAMPFTIRATVLVVAATAVVAFVSAHAPRRGDWPKWANRAGLALLVVAAALLYGRLGYPHNGFPANARIHWVDIYFTRAGEWWYTLVKFPHKLF